MGSFREFRLRHVSFKVQSLATLSLERNKFRCVVQETQTKVEMCGSKDMLICVMICKRQGAASRRSPAEPPRGSMMIRLEKLQSHERNLRGNSKTTAISWNDDA